MPSAAWLEIPDFAVRIAAVCSIRNFQLSAFLQYHGSRFSLILMEEAADQTVVVLWSHKAEPLKTKAPIVPVALIDSYKVFNSFCLGPVTTQVHYLKPILYDEYGGLKTHEIADLVKVRIQEKLDEVLKPAEAPVG